MAEKYSLAAQKREASKTSARDTRNAKRVPGIVYGNGIENISVSVSYSDMLRIYRRAGTASIIDLDIEGKKIPVLIHELNLHPVRDEIHHVDFYQVNLKEKTIVSIPLVFAGESEAVKTLGGTLVKDHDSLSIRCFPADIPHDIQIDISVMKEMHDHITVTDLKLDHSKFELMGLDEDSVICSVAGRSATDSDEPMEALAVEEEVEAEEGSEEKVEK